MISNTDGCDESVDYGVAATVGLIKNSDVEITIWQYSTEAYILGLPAHPRVQLSLGMFLAGIQVESGQQPTDAPGCQRNAGIAGAVIQIDRVSIRADRLSAGEDDIFHIPVTLVLSLRPEHPRVSALQADARILKVKQRRAQTVSLAPDRCDRP